jgi:hypothetical protein
VSEAVATVSVGVCDNPGDPSEGDALPTPVGGEVSAGTAVVNVQQEPKALSLGGDAASSALFRQAYVAPADNVAGTQVVEVP